MRGAGTGIGEVLVGEPAPLPVPAEEPLPPAALEPAAPSGRDARRAAVALGCALATGVAVAAVAPPAAAIAIAALAGLFCHLCLGGR